MAVFPRRKLMSPAISIGSRSGFSQIKLAADLRGPVLFLGRI